MTRLALEQFALRARLAMIRVGWGNGIALGLSLVGIACWVLAIPPLRAQVASEEKALSRARQVLEVSRSPAPALQQRSVKQDRLDAFYDALGEKDYAEQQVKTLFAIAVKTGLNLHHAQYKLALDKAGQYHTYHIDLPVKGPYKAIRQFCEQVLLTIPFASLDELHFKRDTIANPTLEAKLRMTLYLTAAPTSRPSAGGRSEGPP